MPPFALISSTARSIEGLAPWPHSAPLPVNGTRQPILTCRPASFAASASCTGRAANTIAAAASDMIRLIGRFISLTLPLGCLVEIVHVSDRAPPHEFLFWNILSPKTG